MKLAQCALSNHTVDKFLAAHYLQLGPLPPDRSSSSGMNGRNSNARNDTENDLLDPSPSPFRSRIHKSSQVLQKSRTWDSI